MSPRTLDWHFQTTWFRRVCQLHSDLVWLVLLNDKWADIRGVWWHDHNNRTNNLSYFSHTHTNSTAHLVISVDNNSKKRKYFFLRISRLLINPNTNSTSRFEVEAWWRQQQLNPSWCHPSSSRPTNNHQLGPGLGTYTTTTIDDDDNGNRTGKHTNLPQYTKWKYQTKQLLPLHSVHRRVVSHRIALRRHDGSGEFGWWSGRGCHLYCSWHQSRTNRLLPQKFTCFYIFFTSVVFFCGFFFSVLCFGPIALLPIIDSVW